MVMALAGSGDLPSVLVPGGVSLLSEGAEDLGKVQSIGARFAHGEISLDHAAEMGCRACGSPGGGCQFLGTAATSQVVVWRGWYTVDGVDSEEIRRLAVQDRATTVEEDIHLVESVQRGLNSSGYRPGPLVIDPNGGINSERSIEVLQGWMRAAVGGN